MFLKGVLSAVDNIISTDHSLIKQIFQTNLMINLLNIFSRIFSD